MTGGPNSLQHFYGSAGVIGHQDPATLISSRQEELEKLIDMADSHPLKGNQSSRPSLACEGEKRNDFDVMPGVDLFAGSSEALKRTEASLAVVLKQLTAATRSS